MSVEQERLRRADALALLATHRQVKLDEVTAAAYMVALQDLPIDVLEQACREIGHRPRQDYEDKWPDLGTIRAKCESIMRLRREQAESRKLLADKRPSISKERMAEILEQCRQAAKQKAMP